MGEVEHPEEVRCPNCGLERAKGEPVYECVDCGKEGFDCCVPGTREAQARMEER